MQETIAKAVVEVPDVDMNKFKEDILGDFKGLMVEEFKKHKLINKSFEPSSTKVAESPI